MQYEIFTVPAYMVNYRRKLPNPEMLSDASNPIALLLKHIFQRKKPAFYVIFEQNFFSQGFHFLGK